MKINEKTVFLIFVILFVALSKPALKYWSDTSLKHERIKWRTCNVYGPTIEPRPTLEWCTKQKRIEDAVAAASAKNPNPSLNDSFK